MLQRHFREHEAEALRTLEARLPIPAYDYVLKCSHAFNLLDARGVISVTERTAYIARVRDLARKVAGLYLEVVGDGRGEKDEQRRGRGRGGQVRGALLFEIGCEELPDKVCESVIRQLGATKQPGLALSCSATSACSRRVRPRGPRVAAPHRRPGRRRA